MKTSARIDLAWTDNSTDETGFKVERSPDQSVWQLITTTVANAVSYSDTTGLTEGTTYYYRVSSTNTYGDSGYSNIASAETNTKPVMNTIDNKSVNEGALLTFTVTGTDADGNTLTYYASGAPSGASLTTAGVFTYTPTYFIAPIGGTKPYTVQFRCYDSKDYSAYVSMVITVNDVNGPPDAYDDYVKTDQVTPITVNVLANDKEPDNEVILMESVTSPLHGTSVINADKTITYTPTDPDFSGTDYFDYTVSSNSTTANNKDTARVYVAVSSLQDQWEYVIITAGSFVESFQPLLNHKAQKGLTAAVIATGYIYANYTGTEPVVSKRDNADKIRHFIMDAYVTRGTRWVLLGGDAEVVPARGVFAQVGTDIQNSLPTDMYYACLDGPWNGDGDNLWGEYPDGAGGGDIDMLPEIYVGRAPVSNAMEAANFIAKTIQYETAPHPNYSTAVLFGQKLDGATYGSSSMTRIRDAAMPADWNFIEHYDILTYAFPKSIVISDLNANPNMVASLGHSGTTTDSRITTTDVAALTNAFPYFMYSQGCDAGKFDAADCIAETHTVSTYAAFAVVMNARSGWYETGSAPGYSHEFSLEFFDAVFNEGKPHLGEANSDSKEDILLRRGGLGGIYRYVYFETNLFGDPEASFQISASVAHTITASGGPGGTISPNGAVSVIHGASRIFTITPDAGYRVAAVLVDGVTQGAVTSYVFNNVTSDHSIYASFAEDTQLIGDVNRDLVVDVRDIILVAKEFGKTSGFNPNCDINGDGKVDIKDLILAAKNYGK